MICHHLDRDMSDVCIVQWLELTIATNLASRKASTIKLQSSMCTCRLFLPSHFDGAKQKGPDTSCLKRSPSTNAHMMMTNETTKYQNIKISCGASDSYTIVNVLLS